jgi:hypothetical protein
VCYGAPIMAEATFFDLCTTAGRPVTVTTSATGYRIVGGDGLLIALWKHGDVVLSDNGTRVKCRADPHTHLMLRPPPRRRRPWKAVSLGVMTVAALGLAVVAKLPQRHDITPEWRTCQGPAGLAALALLTARLAAPLPAGHRPHQVTVIDAPSLLAILTQPDKTLVVPHALLASAADADAVALALAQALAGESAPALLQSAGITSPALSTDQWAALGQVCR